MTRLRIPVPKAGFPYRAAPVPASIEPPPPKHKVGADYETEWARKLPARVTRAALVDTLMRGTIAGLAAPERKGLDRLVALRDAEEPAIFAANHHSHIDTPLLLTSIPEPWRHHLFVGAAADYFFRTRLTSAAAALALNAIPIERTKVTRRSADQAAALLDDGWSMLIFPEGGRSPDGWGQTFRGGAAYLSLRCGVPVVPVHLEGTGRIMGKGTKRPRPSTTTVTFGAPIRPLDGEDSRKLSTRIEAAVATLADEAATDWYSARRRAHANESPGLGGPELPSWRRAWALGDRARRPRQTKKRWPDL